MKKSIGFKRIVFFSCFIFFLISGSFGQKTPPVYDGINYTAGPLIYDNTNWWCLDTPPVNDIIVSSGSLSYPDFLESTANKIQFSGEGDDIVILFEDRPSDTQIYYSFIFRVTGMAGIATETPAHFAGFTSSTTGSTGCSILIQKDASDPTKFNIGHATRTSLVPSWNLVAGNPVEYSINTPILIVACYGIVGTFADGIPNDISSFWINPSASTFENTLPPAAVITGDLTEEATNDINPVNSFYIRQDAASNTPSIDMDEIRIGLTWASVTPKSVPTGVNEIFNEGGEITISPNPVTDIMKVDVKSTGISYMEIYSTTGRRILTKKADQGITNVDVSSLPQGIYIVSFKGSGGTYKRKFIKK